MGQRIILCDTSVFVGYLRKHIPTQELFNTIPTSEIAVSSITLMEMYRGATNSASLNNIILALDAYEVIYVSESISKLAESLVKDYHLSHKLDIPDALIAATAIELKLPLLTLNLKDFRYLPGIELVYM